MNIQWYPGHMALAKRQMEENLKLIDLVIEVLDARLPGASRNPDIDRMARDKLRLLILTKEDLADASATALWRKAFTHQGLYSLSVDARDTGCAGRIKGAIRELSKEKRERDFKRGIKNRPVRAMIAGIPNCGKSTLINVLAGKKRAKTGNKPGVTRGKQWIALGKELELLDTPGILWPKFEDKEAGLYLAYVGSIRDDILDTGELSIHLLDHIAHNNLSLLENRYGGSFSGMSGDQILREIAKLRGFILQGGEPDTERCSRMLLDEFRSGMIGRITLEYPGNAFAGVSVD